MNRRAIMGFIILSLVLGAGLAGGLYVANTPTNVRPKAAPPTPTIVPVTTALPTVSPTKNPIILPSPTPVGGLTEQRIIDAFGTKSTEEDVNKDGVVNVLDLLKFRQGTPSL